KTRIATQSEGGEELYLNMKKINIFLFCGFLLLAMGMAQRPEPKVYIKQLKNSHYQLIVDKKPYIIKGVCYSPIPIGKNYEYDWWSDPAKPWIVDGKLMQEMGINTVRIYQPGVNPEAVKKVINDLYQLYGIRTILGHWLGFWEYPCPFYAESDFQEKVKKDVLDMVELYKDEPGLLMWVMGNENNYSCLGHVNPWPCEEAEKETDIQKQKAVRARIYYSFVNDLSEAIHKVDSKHPVALGNGELVGLEYAKEYCRDVDLIACIIYRGKTFGNLFKSLKATFDKPVFLAEFGADCYDAYLKKEDQNMQAFFLESQWRQIYENLASPLMKLALSETKGSRSGIKEGTGNCLGGTVFEWTDEWWKNNEHDSISWKLHDIGSNWSNGSYYFDIKADGNKNMNEEWFGIVALSEETENTLNKRVPRKAYYVIREFWKTPGLSKK
ncbi:MAG: hypothetical protein QMD94_05690, partial [Candidatus Omnitrophota bacterium]|nr:hypothetical protein [Candidatus Omnitrophota bacterium]